MADPRIGITFGVNGNDEGKEVRGLEAAARCAADWIRSIDPADVGVDFRISIEILAEDDDG